MKSTPINNKKGFTIIETLVAITILMIAVSGPLTIAYHSLTASVYARDQVVATYLAQDLIEFIKNKRDTNIIANPNDQTQWLNGIAVGSSCAQTSGSTAYCAFDTVVNNASYVALSGASDPKSLLYKAVTSGYFTHDVQSGRSATPFSRYYTVMQKTANQESKLIVTVSWKNGTVPNSITLKSSLFNVHR